MLSIKNFCWRASDLKVFLSRQVHKSYYDSLELTPKASQGEIKRAYYEKSMLYHPDKGVGGTEKFKEISTAYEVLGNNKLRKMYDKGLLPVGAASYAKAKEEVKSKPEVTKEAPRQRPPNYYEDASASGRFDESTWKKKTFTGKTDKYDFDAWTEAHYSETFSKQSAAKAEFERKNYQREKAVIAAQKFDRNFTLAILFIWVGFMFYFRDIYLMQYDKPTPRPRQS